MSWDPLTTPMSFESSSYLPVGRNRRMCDASPEYNHSHSSDAHYHHSDNEEKPKRKETRGRKRIERADAESHRKAQNRAAQRAFKERQINHVKELESKVAELTALLAERDPYRVKPKFQLPSSFPDSSPAALARPSQIEADNQRLRVENESLLSQQAQNICTDCMLYGYMGSSLLASEPLMIDPSLPTPATPTPSASIPSPPTLLNANQQALSPVMIGIPPSVRRVDSTALIPTPSSWDLYGPPDVETMVVELTNLPSLANAHAVIDAFITAFVDTTKCTDAKSIQTGHLRRLLTRRALLDQCTLLDKHACIEILEAGKQRNEKHQQHMFRNLNVAFQIELGVRQGSPAGSHRSVSGDHARVSSIANTVLLLLSNIPALKDAKELTEEMAEIWASTNRPDNVESEQFLRFVEIRLKLQAFTIVPPHANAPHGKQATKPCFDLQLLLSSLTWFAFTQSAKYSSINGNIYEIRGSAPTSAGDCLKWIVSVLGGGNEVAVKNTNLTRVLFKEECWNWEDL
ncbi:hypothetical protein HDU98_003490 [Podochytrium sp. JEL0797]|nr:hypothetical protein HDU98_003490 [Podochytrium sp. JEL0797]